MEIYRSFADAIGRVRNRMKGESTVVENKMWQSVPVTNPLMHTREVRNVSFTVALDNDPEAHYSLIWKRDIEPNLPWADVAFEERVSGIPWNPGKAWESWPWAQSAKRFKTERFSHSYAERYWPSHAGEVEDTTWLKGHPPKEEPVNRGIRFEYGDLNDVVHHLTDDPLSRQAYLPVWFPEDTGVVHKQRVPCTLGYHFIMRDGLLHATYYIRSCDFVRHFRDDIYMSVLLQYWLLKQLRGDGTKIWSRVKLGDFTFHCVSMHMFVNDWNQMFR